MSTRLVWSAALLACALHGRAVGQRAPDKPEKGVTNIRANALPNTDVTTGKLKQPDVTTGKLKQQVDTTLVNGKPVMTIQTDAPTNILNWESFNIGKDATVKIGQQSSSSVLLNNIVNGTKDPTVINGILKSMDGMPSGRVYFYDPAGIVFGAGAQVNLNSLIASTLRFDESRLKAGGLLLPGTGAALSAASTDPNSRRSIWVEGKTAEAMPASITVDNGGQIILAAPGVYNEGYIHASDGQVILAAGDKVYLAAPNVSDSGKLRGLVVEVENIKPKEYPSKASNEENGVIRVDRGNATMVGLAVNQSGVISAQTSVYLNGSIYLKGISTTDTDREKVVKYSQTKDKDKYPLSNSFSGVVTLGARSVTEIVPDDDSNTLTLENIKNFKQSEVQIIGSNISLLGKTATSETGARILAKGGTVDILSVNLELKTPKLLTKDMVRVDLGKGSLIDVSGMNTAQLSMSNNIIEVEMRGAELADNVLLRDSALYGKKINVDIRRGTQIANIDGWLLSSVKYKIDQLNTKAGTVTISSDGAVIQRAGSKLMLDGGGVNYLSGYANTSLLKYYSNLVSVSSAKSGVAYSEIVNLPDGRSNWEQGYYVGSNAGTLNISAQVVGLQGDMSASSQPGLYQRNVSQAAVTSAKLVSAYPLGGTLNLTVKGLDQSEDLVRENSFALLRIGNTTSSNILPELKFNLKDLDSINQMNLNFNALSSKGFQSLTANVAGNIELTTYLSLLPKSTLSLTANQYEKASKGTGNLTVMQGISTPGGTVSLTALRELTLGNSVAINSAGRWTNDAFSKSDELSSNIPVDGGSISLQAHRLNLGNFSTLNASAGAWIDEFNKVKQGMPGTISLVTLFNGGANNDNIIAGIQGLPSTRMYAYGFGAGGKLILSDNLVNIAKSDDLATIKTGGLLLTPDFFSSGGFASFEISSLENRSKSESGNLKIWAGAQVRPVTSSWFLNKPSLPSGVFSTDGYSGPAQLVTYPLSSNGIVRPATTLTLNADRDLLMDSKAGIVADPQSKVNLLAGNQLTVMGYLIAPAGNILLALTSTDFDIARSIWLGPAASLSAPGSSQRIFTDSTGFSKGEILDGGEIKIGRVKATPEEGILTLKDFSSANAYIIAQKGSSINVNGVGADNLQSSLGAINTSLSSNGGSIDILSSQGMLLEATLSGKASTGAKGGSLNLVLDSNSTTYTNPSDNEEYSRFFNILNKATKLKIIPNNISPGSPVVVGSDTDGWILSGTKKGGESTRNIGEAWININSFASGGFGRLQIKSQDVISFDLGNGPMDLVARDAIVLDSPIFMADRYTDKVSYSKTSNAVTFTAPYVLIGGQASLIMGTKSSEGKTYPKSQNAYMNPTPSIGSGIFTVNAQTLELSGTSTLQGFNTANLNSTYDTRLTSSNSYFSEFQADVKETINNHPELIKYLPGQFSMVGTLTLKNSQLYPGTSSQYLLRVNDSLDDDVKGKINFKSNSNLAGSVYSAAGSITAVATYLDQAGIIKAPLGTIILGNQDDPKLPLTKSLIYEANSLTSVKGEVAMLFGDMLNGSVATSSSWSISANNSSGISKSLLLEDANVSKQYRSSLPTKQILSRGAEVTVTSGAVLDASAGGQLLSYEFTPGKGGSKDVLDVLSAPNTFAILPGFTGKVAPADPNNVDSNLGVGDKIYLSGTWGLPAGTYTLLPAHYALLPGGFSVRVQPKTLGMSPQANRVLPDGTALVSGSIMSASQTSGNARGYLVSSHAVIRKSSEITLYDADGKEDDAAYAEQAKINLWPLHGYFAKQADINLLSLPEMPSNAGYMQFVASQSIGLNGKLNMPSGALDISVTKANSILTLQASSTNLASNTLSTDNLNQLQLSSLMIGGQRFYDTKNKNYKIINLTPKVMLNEDSKVSASDIIMVASDTIEIKSGAKVLAESSPLFDIANFNIDGDATSIRVNGSQDNGRQEIQVTHLNPNLKFQKGVLILGVGASIQSVGSVYLDATGSMNLNSNLPVIGDTGLLGLAAPGISFVNTVSSSSDGLQLAASQLETLKSGQRLSLNSFNKPISFETDVTIGASDTQGISSLTIKSAGLKADNESITVALNAQTVKLEGVESTPLTASLIPSTNLNINSNQLLVGNGLFALTGFASTAFNVSGQIKAAGDKGTLVTRGALFMSANEFTADNIKSARFVSAGPMTLAKTRGSVSAVSQSIGGELAFTSPQIISDADINLPSGLLTFNHPEDFKEDVGSIQINGGTLNVSGASKSFGKDAYGKGLIAYAPAGSIELNANTISINGGTFDVSSKGAAAGSIAIQAESIQGNGNLSKIILKGQADDKTQAQGQFSLSTNGFDVFGTGLNEKIIDAGFTESVSYRLINGNLSMGPTDVIRAHNVTLTADNGNIYIAGTLDASGPKGGNIYVYAAQPTAYAGKGNIFIRSTAVLDASSTADAKTVSAAGSLGKGGYVLLSTSTHTGDPTANGSSINFDGGLIKVAGKKGKDGSVLMRVPSAVGDNAAISFTNNPTSFDTNTNAVLEVFKVFQGYTNIDETNYTDFTAYVDSFASISGNLSRPSSLKLRPGIEVRSADNLTVSVNEFATDASQRGWDLSKWRFNDQPINLTLRAAENLTINGSISDGFVNPNDYPNYNPYDPSNANGAYRSGMAMPNWALGRGDSADINLVAGADFDTAHTLSTKRSKTTGDFTLGFAERKATDEPARVNIFDMPVALVRTGTGKINVTAGGNVVLKLISLEQLVDIENNRSLLVYTSQIPSIDLDSYKSTLVVGGSIYTSGEVNVDPDLLSSNIPINVLNPHYMGGKKNVVMTPAVFSKNGGSLNIKAKRNILGPRNNENNWYYQNGDYSVSIETADPITPDVPASKTKAGYENAFKLAQKAADDKLKEIQADQDFKEAYITSFKIGEEVFYTTDEKAAFINEKGVSFPVSDYIDESAKTRRQNDLELINKRIVKAVDAKEEDKWYAEVVAKAAKQAQEAAGETSRFVKRSIEITAVRYATEDWLPTSVSPLVNNWLFRQGRSNTTATGTSEFAQLNPTPDGTCADKKCLTTAWWARSDYFNQSFATLGGGDLSVKAGGAIKNIYASTATNAYMTGSAQSATLQESGGGDLYMTAIGDIAGAALYVQKGKAFVSTQQSVTTGDNWIYPSDRRKIHTKKSESMESDGLKALDTVIALGDAQLYLSARKDLELEAIYNPMLAEQSKYNRTSTKVTGTNNNEEFLDNLLNYNGGEVNGLAYTYPRFGYSGFSPLYLVGGLWNTSKKGVTGFENLEKFQNNFSQFSTFSTYTNTSQVKLLSLGNITQLNRSNLLAASDGVMVLNDLQIGQDKFNELGFDRYYTTSPAQLLAVAMGGRYESSNGFTLMPSTNSQLSVWAQGDVTLNNGSAGAIHILDVLPSSLSNQEAPRLMTQKDMDLLKDSYTKGPGAHFQPEISNLNPVSSSSYSRIVSLRDIVGDAGYATFSLNLPKASSIIAGRDIVNLGFVIQNTQAGDISLVKAGRDIRDETIDKRQQGDCTEISAVCIAHVLTGPGRLKYVAGRDIDLGSQKGIVTRGNSDNPFLPEGGASIQITTAGLEPDYVGWTVYLQTLLNQKVDQSNILNYEQLKDDIRNPLLIKFKPNEMTEIEKIGDVALKDAAKNELFFNTVSGMTDTEKNKLFFQSLYTVSLLKDKATKKITFTYFDDDIASLFPNLKNASAGNLSSHSSQIKTEQGGSIDIFTPTGSVYAGLPIGKQFAKPFNQGLFTVRGGDINALVSQKFLVNLGRVFTLAGGDITLISQFGDLEAGKGSKTASASPPPRFVVATDGSVSVDVSASVAGSGIGALVTKPNQPRSSIFAAAPRGYIDAGDAGFRADNGDIGLNTEDIRNPDNFRAPNGIVPTQQPQSPVAAPPPPPPPAASNTADDAKKTLAAGANPNNNLANLSVELLGFGETDAGSSANSKDKDKDKDKDKEDKEKN